jgi:hypothetical protein
VATRAPKDHSESEHSVYERWARELAEQGVGVRRLAEVCWGERGRPATRVELDAALTALAGPGGLTEQASTFTRTDVVDALAKRLPVARSAQEALTQAEDAADRFLNERAVRVAHDRRLGVDRFSTPELLTLDSVLPKGLVSIAAASKWSAARPRVGLAGRAVRLWESIGAKSEAVAAGQAAVGVGAGRLRVWRQSLSRLWVPHSSFHSASQAARPRRVNRRAPCCSLSCPKTGSTVSLRLA